MFDGVIVCVHDVCCVMRVVCCALFVVCCVWCVGRFMWCASCVIVCGLLYICVRCLLLFRCMVCDV